MWDGTHYGKTSEAWLQNMDQNKDEIMKIFENTYGIQDAKVWFQRWRIFFMSCAELFNYKNGTEWGVSHYLFTRD
jgi:cyclopropane-fatty-acyl-phospholipid synthase